MVLKGGAVPPSDEHHREESDQPMNQLDEGEQERQHQREEWEDMFGGTVGVVRARDLTEEGEAEEPPRQRQRVSEADEQVILGGQEMHEQHGHEHEHVGDTGQVEDMAEVPEDAALTPEEGRGMQKW